MNSLHADRCIEAAAGGGFSMPNRKKESEANLDEKQLNSYRHIIAMAVDRWDDKKANGTPNE
jgi:hypothetical protein